MLELTAQTIVGLFFTADRDVLLWVMTIAFFLSVAVVALLARNRRWPEIVCIFFLVYLAWLGVAHVFFKHVVDVPFMKMELVSITTNR